MKQQTTIYKVSLIIQLEIVMIIIQLYINTYNIIKYSFHTINIIII